MVAGLADQVMVMYAGRQVEMGTTDEIFYESRHPYTLGLLASLPRLDDVGRGAAAADHRVAAVAHPPPRRVAPSTRGAGSPGCPGLCNTEVPELRLVAGDAHRVRVPLRRDPRRRHRRLACGREVDEAELVAADGFVDAEHRGRRA